LLIAPFAFRKIKNMNTSPLRRRRILLLAAGTALAIAGALNLSFTVARVPSNIWTQLGISETRGLDNIRRSFLEGYLYTYGASAAKKIALGDRVAVANDLMSYSKSYVSSSAFRELYQQTRTLNKPAQPAAPKSKAEIQATQIATLEKSIAETEKSRKAMPADMQDAMKDVQKMLREQVEDFKNPDSEMLGFLVDAEKYNHQTAMQQFEASVQAWQQNYPEDHRQMIRARLEKFLTVTGDVDYNAALHDEYGLKKFNNATYERKPDEWKMAFRAGKPVVDAARSFATARLTELK
jgi:hypothetical protein